MGSKHKVRKGMSSWVPEISSVAVPAIGSSSSKEAVDINHDDQAAQIDQIELHQLTKSAHNPNCGRINSHHKRYYQMIVHH